MHSSSRNVLCTLTAEVRHMEPDHDMLKKEKVLGQVVRYTKIQYLTCGGYIYSPAIIIIYRVYIIIVILVG